MTFTKRETGGYMVKSASGEIVGAVYKSEGWTVRGAPTIWSAVRKGRVLGSFSSRNDAGAFLVNRQTSA